MVFYALSHCSQIQLSVSTRWSNLSSLRPPCISPLHSWLTVCSSTMLNSITLTLSYATFEACPKIHCSRSHPLRAIEEQNKTFNNHMCFITTTFLSVYFLIALQEQKLLEELLLCLPSSDQHGTCINQGLITCVIKKYHKT